MITYIVYAFLVYLLIGMIYVGRFLYNEFSLEYFKTIDNSEPISLGLIIGSVILLIFGLIVFLAWLPIKLKYKL